MYIKTSTFDLVKEKAKTLNGYLVAHFVKEDGMVDLFHYATKKEFETQFGFFSHILYNTTGLVPKDIIEDYETEWYCVIDDQEMMFYSGNSYLFIDGKIQK